MQKKLIIWDFDGVIADTDYIWMKMFYQKLVTQKQYQTPFEEFHYKCGGMSGITIKKTFNKLGYELNDSFLKI